MTVRDLYTDLITKQIIKEILYDEELPTPSEIQSRLTTHEESHDLSLPAHTLEQSKVSWSECSSAAKHNTTFRNIGNDLSISYQSLLDISNTSNRYFERWRQKATILEDRLSVLSDNISNLLLLQQDTVGYYNFVQVDLKTLTDVDLENTTTRLDTSQGHASIGTSSTSVSRYFPLDHVTEEDIEFIVLTRQAVSAIAASQQSSLKNAFDGTTAYWQEKVHTSKVISVSAELKIKLAPVDTVQISRIDIDIHASNRSDVMQVLPLYSKDGKTWEKLPITNYFLSITNRGTFQFSPLSALYVKFIFTKTGADQVLSEGGYIYEFGITDIAFLNEVYSTAIAGQQLITNPLSIVSPTTKSNEKFSKVSLEVCELIEEGDTDIEYSVAASNDSSMTPSSATWMSISPLDRDVPRKAQIIDFGEADFYERSGIGLSYDPLNTTSQFVDPAETFSALSSMSGTTGTHTTATSSAQRYLLRDPSFKILELGIAPDIEIAKGTLQLWRNTLETKGDTSQVRDNPVGWGLGEDDHYKTTVLVKSATGIEIDFGPQNIIIDDVNISGTFTVSKGIHTIKIHKDNFSYVDHTSITTLVLLKTEDLLYPYNHRYLIEGFNYPSSWSDTVEKVYKGFDIVAETLMQQVGVVDLLSSVREDDYSRFAIDIDARDTGRTPTTLGTDSYKVFLLRVDSTNTDLINETFLVRFRPANVEYEYLILRAILKSTDQNKTPYLSTMRLKVGA